MDESNYPSSGSGSGSCSAHSSVYIAPLAINKAVRRSSSSASRKSRRISQQAHSRSHSHGAHSQSSSQLHFTPPPTPRTSQESLNEQAQQQGTQFLRAFFPFHPTYTPNSSTVTLPLNIGDVILVHSIHTNGWADGTMLSSGARGWLPTNYCEPYETTQIKLLLKACMHLFEQFRTGTSGGVRVSQIAVTGIVAGVRQLLELTECLTRDALYVKASDRVAKSRKVLLTELSGLVKGAKRLPGHSEHNPDDVVEDVTDEMILRSFKIVLRAVRFLDIWYDQYEGGSVSEPVHEEEEEQRHDDGIPPTPPCESFSYNSTSSSSTSLQSYAHTTVGTSGDSYFEPLSTQLSIKDHHGFPLLGEAVSANIRQESHPLPSTPYGHTPRGTSPESAHYSSNRHSTESSAPVYALARLNTSHDVLLSYLGSYIGRIHLQSRFTPQLQLTQQQSVAAAKDLLTVVEAVYARDQRAQALAIAKDAMYERVAALISAARDIVANRFDEEEEDEDGGIMIRDGGRCLIEAATGCVRGAGECVAKSKFVIERIGDFEMETDNEGIGLGITTDASTLPVVEPPVEVHVTGNAGLEEDDSEDSMPPPTPDKIPPPPPPKEDPIEQPPTHIRRSSQLRVETNLIVPTSSMLLPPTPTTDDVSRRSSAISMLPLMSNVEPEDNDTSSVKELYEPKPQYNASIRAESMGGDSSATDSITMNSLRGSEFSIMSETSTRASTPEPVSSSDVKPPLIEMVSESDASVATEPDLDNQTSRSLEHELTYNKDGQITGGTLAALVEKLTVHDSTPDAVFVATFYLTFRLFSTPAMFAEALVDRFEAVAMTNTVSAMPVRLRVYNVFKGWLESHWRGSSDKEALDIIRNFAETDLGDVLPAASRRLLELIEKVGSVDAPLVPRLVSNMGKSSTATTTYSVVETQIASPIMSRSQLTLLKSAITPGGNKANVLDFDPLEMARQLTLKESRMFCSIAPEELIAQEWTKKQNSIATNVLAMSSLSTDLAHLVADTILGVEDTKSRARVIKQWIKVADRCLELNNYDSLMAIMCTMNTSTIVRLKKTWELVSHKTKQVLEHLRSVIDVSKNHAVLRARLRGHVPPCLPFLGTYLTDLTFVDVGNPSKRPVSIDGTTKQLINFDKHVKTSKIISELQRFQIPYRIAEVPEMQKWIDQELERIHNSKAADVQHLYRRSLLLEPRENQMQRMISDSQSPPIPTPTLQKEASGKSDLFAWAHVFKTPAN